MGNKELSQCIIKARGKMSQEEFANLSGVGRTTIAALEAGSYKSKLTLNTVLKIAAASSMPIEELLLASGYTSNDLPNNENHPLINAVHDVLRGHEYLLLNSDDIRLIKATVNTLITELKNK